MTPQFSASSSDAAPDLPCPPGLDLTQAVSLNCKFKIGVFRQILL